MQVDIYTKDGQQSGTIELNDDVFAIEPNEHAMHKAIIVLLAHKRQGTAKTKTRKDVSGGGKKPWRQKGRGTARAGSSRSPVWVGGGTIHGPHPRQYKLKINRKLSKLARRSALSLRLSEQNLMVVEDFSFEQIKTKQMAQVLKNLKLDSVKTLLLLSDYDGNVYRSGRNIEKLSIFPADKISTYDILNHKKIVLFKGAVETIEKSLTN